MRNVEWRRGVTYQATKHKSSSSSSSMIEINTHQKQEICVQGNKSIMIEKMLVE